MIDTDNDWLPKQPQETPLDRFLDVLGGNIIINNGTELIIKTFVLNLLSAIKPMRNFILNGQREVDEERVSELVASQRHEQEIKGHYGISSTIITLGYCPEQLVLPPPDGKNEYGITILDGQHRAKCFITLYNTAETRNTLLGVETLVKICIVDHQTDLIRQFKTININSVPVSMYNLNDEIKKTVDGVICWLKNSFDKSFFTEKGAMRPHINTHDITKKLSESKTVQELITLHAGNTSECIKIICQKFQLYNDHLQTWEPEEFAIGLSSDLPVCKRAHDKCMKSTHRLFVGMEKNYVWIDKALTFGNNVVRKIVN